MYVHGDDSTRVRASGWELLRAVRTDRCNIRDSCKCFIFIYGTILKYGAPLSTASAE